MAFADELYKAAAPIWEAQLKHPFVRGLGDGTLPAETFQHWLRQDYVFLLDYARLLAWSAAKADQLDSMRWFASLLHLTLGTEMALHRQYAARYGLDAAQLEQYSSPDFVQAAEWLKEELGRLTRGIGNDKKRRLMELFLLSSRYELLFWDMCWQGEEWPA